MGNIYKVIYSIIAYNTELCIASKWNIMYFIVLVGKTSKFIS